MYGGLSVNPALQGMKKITKAEVQFTDPRLTRSLKHFFCIFILFLLKLYVFMTNVTIHSRHAVLNLS